MRKLMLGAVATLALATGSCAQGWINHAKDTCGSIGYTANSSQYADCVERQFEHSRTQWNRAMDSLGETSVALSAMSANMQAQTNALNASIYRGPPPQLTCYPSGWHNGTMYCQ